MSNQQGQQPSNRERFLRPRLVPSVNPHVQEELFYEDKDHRLAHGHGDAQGASNLIKMRTISTSHSTLFPNGLPVFNDTSAFAVRKRRTSHDEKIVAKQRTFLIDVEETKRMRDTIPHLSIGKILAQEDTDGDSQITVHDGGPKSFILGTADSGGYQKFEIRGHYMLSNLLQELALASEHNRRFIILHENRLNENPVDRMTRLIKFHFWDALTRRIDAQGLERICEDPKNRSSDQQNRIYVPFHDPTALEYYKSVALERPHLNLDVIQLPEVITPIYVKSINFHPGILSLALRKEWDPLTNTHVTRGVPFVVPGGRFNEMYGWDSYFEALGLLVDGRVELARSMTENFMYEIEHYGKILNANRSYYLTRSQPPFLTDMILQCLVKLRLKPEWPTSRCRIWLLEGMRASIKELLSVWMTGSRLDGETGLSKYHTEGIGMPTETESTHFNHILEPFAKKHHVDVEKFKEMYLNDEVIEPDLDDYFVHDRAVRESGHDTTYRFEGKCAHLATVDLNSLLYKYAMDIGHVLGEHFEKIIKLHIRKGPNNVYFESYKIWEAKVLEKGVSNMIGNHGGWECSWAKGIKVYDDVLNAEYLDGTPEDAFINDLCAHEDSDNDDSIFIAYLHADLFLQIASRNQELVTKYLWSPSESLFFDYDCYRKELTVYESVTCFWTLWSGVATPEQAKMMVPKALSLFEVTGGLVCGTENSRGRIGVDRPNRQWDYPYGWAPHQILAWVGLEKYGFLVEARRLAYRWLYTLTKSFFDFNGVVPEKFDVVNLTHKVDVEYGNVGADFKFVVKEGFGWMNASYQLGILFMTKHMRRALGTLTPPDRLFYK